MKARRAKWERLIVVALLGSLPAGCAMSKPPARAALVLGTLLPRTGADASLYRSLSAPVALAVAEIDAAGGVNGRPVVVRAADDGSSADVASASLGRLAAQHATAVVGPSTSGLALGIAGELPRDRIVGCSGSATSSALTTADTGGYFFRTAPSDELQGAALGALLLTDGRRDVDVVDRHDSFGAAYASAIGRAVARGGGRVTEVPYDPSATELGVVAAAVAHDRPDAVVIAGFPADGGRVIASLVAAGLGPRDVPTYTVDAMQSSAADPSTVQGIKGTAPAVAPAGAGHAFGTAFRATAAPDVFSSYYYDCTMLLALAAQAARSDDPARIRDEMVHVSRGGTRCRTYAACIALLRRGRDIDYDGASGRVDLDGAHGPTTGAYDVWEFDAHGRPEPVAGRAQIHVTSR